MPQLHICQHTTYSSDRLRNAEPDSQSCDSSLPVFDRVLIRRQEESKLGNDTTRPAHVTNVTLARKVKTKKVSGKILMGLFASPRKERINSSFALRTRERLQLYLSVHTCGRIYLSTKLSALEPSMTVSGSTSSLAYGESRQKDTDRDTTATRMFSELGT
jgi:hypothetical protein